MKIKTSEAEGPALDWLVSTITNPEWEEEDRRFNTYEWVNTGDPEDEQYSPTTNWAQGGPIIEREKIATVPLADGWEAQYEPEPSNLNLFVQHGPTPLIAAMRCFIVSELGPEAEVPEEL